MLVVGLSGGKLESQCQIMKQATSCGLKLNDTDVRPFMVQLGHAEPKRRLKILRDILDSKSNEDLKWLLMPLVANVSSSAEAEYIRSLGGEIWHLTSPCSSEVPIQLGEPLIDVREINKRLYMTPAQAIKQLVHKHLSEKTAV